MQHISPVKIIAGIVAILLALTVVFFGSKMRQGVMDILSMPRAKPAAATHAPQPNEGGAIAVGSRVIPIGVVAQPSSGNAGQSK